MTDLALENKALQDQLKTLTFQNHVFRGLNQSLLQQNQMLQQDLKSALEVIEQALNQENADE